MANVTGPRLGHLPFARVHGTCPSSLSGRASSPDQPIPVDRDRLQTLIAQGPIRGKPGSTGASTSGASTSGRPAWRDQNRSIQNHTSISWRPDPRGASDPSRIRRRDPVRIEPPRPRIGRMRAAPAPKTAVDRHMRDADPPRRWLPRPCSTPPPPPAAHRPSRTPTADERDRRRPAGKHRAEEPAAESVRANDPPRPGARDRRDPPILPSPAAVACRPAPPPQAGTCRNAGCSRSSRCHQPGVSNAGCAKRPSAASPRTASASSVGRGGSCRASNTPGS